MNLLTEIHGIGPVLAKKLYNKMNPKPKTKEQVFEQLNKIKDELPIATQIDLKHQPTSITWEEIDKFNNKLRKTIHGIKWKIAGGYRRHKPVSNDIDIVISKGNKKNIFQKWMDMVSSLAPYIIFYEPYAVGPSKVNTIVKIGAKKVRVDIFLVEPNEWICSLLYATGSGQFNIMMRSIAKRKGYLLNQKCLMSLKSNKCILVKNEKQIFEVLGMEWVSPRNRAI